MKLKTTTGAITPVLLTAIFIALLKYSSVTSPFIITLDGGKPLNTVFDGLPSIPGLSNGVSVSTPCTKAVPNKASVGINIPYSFEKASYSASLRKAQDLEPVINFSALFLIARPCTLPS
jgi:hypothetical protein